MTEKMDVIFSNFSSWKLHRTDASHHVYLQLVRCNTGQKALSSRWLSPALSHPRRPQHRSNDHATPNSDPRSTPTNVILHTMGGCNGATPSQQTTVTRNPFLPGKTGQTADGSSVGGVGGGQTKLGDFQRGRTPAAPGVGVGETEATLPKALKGRTAGHSASFRPHNST